MTGRGKLCYVQLELVWKLVLCVFSSPFDFVIWFKSIFVLKQVHFHSDILQIMHYFNFFIFSIYQLQSNSRVHASFVRTFGVGYSMHLITICRCTNNGTVNSAIKPHSRIITLMESVSYVRYTVSLMPRVFFSFSFCHHSSIVLPVDCHYKTVFSSIWSKNERNGMIHTATKKTLTAFDRFWKGKYKHSITHNHKNTIEIKKKPLKMRHVNEPHDLHACSIISNSFFWVFDFSVMWFFASCHFINENGCVAVFIFSSVLLCYGYRFYFNIFSRYYSLFWCVSWWLSFLFIERKLIYKAAKCSRFIKSLQIIENPLNTNTTTRAAKSTANQHEKNEHLLLPNECGEVSIFA